MTSDKTIDSWLTCVVTMFNWYKDNFGPFYDFEHGKDKSKLKACDLINNKIVRADCSGFVNACLVLFGELTDTLKYNVTHGSYNYSKKRNDPNYYGFMPNIKYLRNDLTHFKHIKVNENTKFKNGDILYNKEHVVIFYDNYVYEWGSSVEKRDLEKNDGKIRIEKILDPYHRIQKYIGIWRLDNER